MEEEKKKKKDHRKALIVWTIIVSVVLVAAIVLSVVFTYSLTDGYSNLYGLYPDEVLSLSESGPDENGVVTRDISEVKNGERTDYEEYIAPDGSVYDFYPYYVSIDMGQGSLFDVCLVFEEKPSKDDLYFNSYPKAVATCANVSSMYLTENYFWYFDEDLYKKYYYEFNKNYFQEEIKTGDVYRPSSGEDSYRYDVSGFFRDGFYTLSAKVEGKEYGYDFYLDTNSPVRTGSAGVAGVSTIYESFTEYRYYYNNGATYNDVDTFYVEHDYGVGYESAYAWLTFHNSVVKEDFEFYDEFVEWIDKNIETYIDCSDDLVDGAFGYSTHTKEEYATYYNDDAEYPETKFGTLYLVWRCWGQYMDPFPDYELHCYLVDFAGNVVDLYGFQTIGRI